MAYIVLALAIFMTWLVSHDEQDGALLRWMPERMRETVVAIPIMIVWLSIIAMFAWSLFVIFTGS